TTWPVWPALVAASLRAAVTGSVGAGAGRRLSREDSSCCAQPALADQPARQSARRWSHWSPRPTEAVQLVVPLDVAVTGERVGWNWRAAIRQAPRTKSCPRVGRLLAVSTVPRGVSSWLGPGTPI